MSLRLPEQKHVLHEFFFNQSFRRCFLRSAAQHWEGARYCSIYKYLEDGPLFELNFLEADPLCEFELFCFETLLFELKPFRH